MPDRIAYVVASLGYDDGTPIILEADDAAAASISFDELRCVRENNAEGQRFA